MAKEKQKQKKPQLTKEKRLELEQKLSVHKSLPRYVKNRIKKEKEIKKEIIASGKEYYGILLTLEDQLKRLKNDTYWGEDTTAGIESQLKG